MSSPAEDGAVTAAVLITGDEILSGRTQDTNLRDIALNLGVHGVDLIEACTVSDVHEDIIALSMRSAPATTTSSPPAVLAPFMTTSPPTRLPRRLASSSTNTPTSWPR